jgi:hypothetical protein
VVIGTAQVARRNGAKRELRKIEFVKRGALR